jgi:hypothetical protein
MKRHGLVVRRIACLNVNGIGGRRRKKEGIARDEVGILDVAGVGCYGQAENHGQDEAAHDDSLFVAADCTPRNQEMATKWYG